MTGGVEEILLDLPDGRTLEVQVSGPADGVPLVWHHGTPGCAYQSAGKQAAAHSRGLRLVSYSRAGAGRSTRHPGRTVADVAADLEAVLDRLGAQRCLTAGQSGGGPHTLAMAALLPDRVAAVASVCGVRPYESLPGEGEFLDGMGELNVEEFSLALAGEAALRPFVESHAPAIATADADAVIADLASLLPEVDRAVLTGEVGADILANLRGGVARIDGWVDDDLAFTRPWGFDPAAIAVPAYIWQGTADLMVPPAHGEALARRMPEATVRILPGEGHLSIAVGRLGDILDGLVSHL